jgi:uncharacterized protein (TIGR02145 family)
MKNLIKFVALIFLPVAVVLHSCKKEVVPTLKTEPVTNITGTSATSGGMITDEGSGNIVERGVCWSKGFTPTIADNRTIEGGGAGIFVSIMTNLDVATEYNVRAYATNVAGTGYGIARGFTTMGKAPDDSTLAAANITAASATLRGAINANYLSTTVTFEYGTTTSYGQTVTASPSLVISNSNTDVTADIGALTGGTTYHYRVKALNSLGTTYGEDMSFMTLLADIDGNVYKVVTIGTQVWMAENLKATKFNDSSDIRLAADNTAWYQALSPGYCWFNNDKDTFGNIYGALYNWFAISTSFNGNKNICPTGWHVPTEAEWKAMENYLIANNYNYDGTTTGDKIAKSLASTIYWQSSTNQGAVGNTDYPEKRNMTGFTALPAGDRQINGLYWGFGTNAVWWNSTGDTYFGECVEAIIYESVSLNSGTTYPRDHRYYGLSVRCLKD